MKQKRVADSISIQTHMLRCEDINGVNRLFGGAVLSWIDEVASTVGRRHCQTFVTSAAIDNLSFLGPAHIDDLVSVEGRATYVGNTSMEVRVDVYEENYDLSRRLINRSYFTIVALDKDGMPIPIQYGLLLETEEEKEEWENALKRIEYRKLRKREGF